MKRSADIIDACLEACDGNVESALQKCARRLAEVEKTSAQKGVDLCATLTERNDAQAEAERVAGLLGEADIDRARLDRERDAALRSLERVRVVATIPPKTALVLDDSDAFLAVVRLRHNLRDALEALGKLSAAVTKFCESHVNDYEILCDANDLARASLPAPAGGSDMPTAGESPAPFPGDER